MTCVWTRKWLSWRLREAYRSATQHPDHQLHQTATHRLYTRGKNHHPRWSECEKNLYVARRESPLMLVVTWQKNVVILRNMLQGDGYCHEGIRVRYTSGLGVAWLLARYSYKCTFYYTLKWNTCPRWQFRSHVYAFTPYIRPSDDERSVRVGTTKAMN